MRVLIACEFSGVVRDAFRALGHDAWSCDLLPSDAPGPHYQGDVRHLLNGWMPVLFAWQCVEDDYCPVCGEDFATCAHPGPRMDEMEYLHTARGDLYARPIDHPHWDLMIAHPPCTYLSSSGLHRNKRVPGRQELTEQAILFVLELAAAPIERICIENPIGCLSTKWRKPDQIIQPWQFGHDASKATCLWLKNLPLLQPTDVLPGGNKARRANQCPSGQNKLGPSPDRWKLRSVTYAGIAAAMAEQWGA